MEVKTAKSAGFCFGVKRAVEKAYEVAGEKKSGVYTYGSIIHNEEVVGDLEKRGVSVLNSEEELKALSEGTVIIRSHGVPRRIYEVLREKEMCIRDRFRRGESYEADMEKINWFNPDRSMRPGYDLSLIHICGSGCKAE